MSTSKLIALSICILALSVTISMANPAPPSDGTRDTKSQNNPKTKVRRVTPHWSLLINDSVHLRPEDLDDRLIEKLLFI